MIAERAQGDIEKTSLPDIDGAFQQTDFSTNQYNLAELANSLVISKRVAINPIDEFYSEISGISNLPFKRIGQLNSEGAAFLYEQPLFCNIAAGTSFLFMHVDNRQEFCFDPIRSSGVLNDTKILQLNSLVNDCLGLKPAVYSRTVFGDLDLYLRWNCFLPYTCKFRAIDLGFKLGVYAPTSPEAPINNPAAIPVGGNGHWGIYFDLENQYEVKEDMFARIMFRAIKRFKRTSLQRMPVGLEPSKYGAVVGQLEVNPGWSFVFNPSVTLEGIREGLGVSAIYTLVAHLQDTFTDRRADKTIPVNLGPVAGKSSWGVEHISIGAFYDFAKYKECRRCLPTLSVYWDMPVDWLVSKRSARTNAISIMLDMDF